MYSSNNAHTVELYTQNKKTQSFGMYQFIKKYGTRKKMHILQYRRGKKSETKMRIPIIEIKVGIQVL